MVSTFQEEEINAIDILLNDDCWMTKVPPFVKLIWFHAFQLIKNHIIENQDNIVVNIGQQVFSEATYMLNQFSMVMIFLCIFVFFLTQIKVHFLNGK